MSISVYLLKSGLRLLPHNLTHGVRWDIRDSFKALFLISGLGDSLKLLEV
jgi:hypothetical protein